MLTLSDVSLPESEKLFARSGLEAAFIVPTKNGMEKSIMDATLPVREFLLRMGIHDFSAQGKGPGCKRCITAHVINGEAVACRTVSLYRPETKDGDPRIWIYGLAEFATWGNLLALIVDGLNLYVVNCTTNNLQRILTDKESVLGKIAAKADIYAPVAKDLLEKLREVAARGFVPNLRPGDTGVGYTLETHLGIKANARRAPDYHGIEIKSGRMGRKAKAAAGDRITLFSQVPNWGISPLSARATLESFGYRNGVGRLQLFCSIDARAPNRLGFRLAVRHDDAHLANVNHRRIDAGEDVFLWGLQVLREAFSEKHRETFWVGAVTRREGMHEQFHYVEARHTRRPMLATFDRLLEAGGICVDLTMSERGSQKAVRDHGYLFRLYGPFFEELFPQVGTYALT